MSDIKIQTAEYIECPKTGKEYWLFLCTICSDFKHRNIDFTITCWYEEKDNK